MKIHHLSNSTHTTLQKQSPSYSCKPSATAASTSKAKKNSTSTSTPTSSIPHDHIYTNYTYEDFDNSVYVLFPIPPQTSSKKLRGTRKLASFKEKPCAPLREMSLPLARLCRSKALRTAKFNLHTSTPTSDSRTGTFTTTFSSATVTTTTPERFSPSSNTRLLKKFWGITSNPSRSTLGDLDAHSQRLVSSKTSMICTPDNAQWTVKPLKLISATSPRDTPRNSLNL
eukprot:TRINITY_DN1941_c0_g1_i3.p1 TRINITY_DN1941_c0_g1~~TRINITY_DN1941_c0_g1_i3.p1  ORF type:complete len:227 (+),score=16.10 TRINITY_DN1941_c0_g1_i3:133-813(+)